MSSVGVMTYRSKEESRFDFCTILINAGLIHKVGPNRVYVKLARELAFKGTPCFRFDYAGQGDSLHPNVSRSFENIKNTEIIQAMDAVQKNTGINRFVLIGICSGAVDAFKVSLEDNRIIGLSLIDGVYQDKILLNSIYPIAQRKSKIRYYKKYLFNYRRWMKILTGKSGAITWGNLLFIVRFVSSQVKRKIIRPRKINNEIAKTETHSKVNFSICEWKKLFDKKTKIYLIFCEGDIAIDIFNLTIAKELINQNYKDIQIELINDVDHTFTPIWAQELLIAKINEWINNISNTYVQ